MTYGLSFPKFLWSWRLLLSIGTKSGGVEIPQNLDSDTGDGDLCTNNHLF